MSNKKKLWIDYIPMGLAAVLIIFCALWRGQSFIKTLPTLITLVVQIMLARASRYAFLLGGCNSVLYAISYFSEELYFSAFLAVVVSMPMQIYSYFNWKKNARGSDPNIRALPIYLKIVTVAAISVGWLACWKFLGEVTSLGEFVAVDSLVFVMGLAVTVLSAVRYVDAQYLHLISSVLSLILWITIAHKNPQNINYVIIALYNLFKGIEITVVWSKLCVKTPTNFNVRKGETNENKSFS